MLILATYLIYIDRFYGLLSIDFGQLRQFTGIFSQSLNRFTAPPKLVPSIFLKLFSPWGGPLIGSGQVM